MTLPRQSKSDQGAAGRAPWTPELSLQQMDKFDNAVSILSMTQMGDILYDGTEKGRKAARTGNEYGAKVMADHPKRFGLFTGVPLPEDTLKAGLPTKLMAAIERGNTEKLFPRFKV